MSRRQLFLASALVTCFGLVNEFSVANAEEYVWARTAWGSSNINARYSAPNNGYGGYYVPKNAAGNNYESQGNFRNPNGYIIPSNATGVQQSSHSPLLHPFRRRFWQH